MTTTGIKEDTKEFFKMLAQCRYLSKRVAGKSPIRSDGSLCTDENDIQSTAAEYFVSQQFGCPFNASISSVGDGGCDFKLEISVEVIWLGVNRDGSPRTPEDGCHLIVNPHEPHRWADVYVAVSGTVEGGFKIVGWTTHKALEKQPKKDFGYGERFAMKASSLYTSDLRFLKRD